MIETTTGWLWLYSMLGLIIGYWLVITIRENGFQSGYWKGRKDGYDMHRRIADNKSDANNN